MRADRLLSIVWLLRGHGKLTVSALAENLNVSRRTILRDIEALSSAGVPVYAERGPHGGIHLLPGYRTEVAGLSSDESRALFAGVTAWGADSLGLGEALASGLRKLLAAVPEGQRDLSREASARIVVDPQGWLPQTDSEQNGSTLHTLQEAVFSQTRVRIDQRAARGAHVRSMAVDPHGLVSAGRAWYLCATCEGEIRFLKVARIQSAELLNEPCPDDSIDVAAQWRAHRARFHAQFTPITATVWVNGSRIGDVHEWAISATAVRTDGEPPEAGWALMSLGFVDQVHAQTILLRLGSDALVVAPTSLVDDYLAYVNTILARYGDTDTSRIEGQGISSVSR